MSLIVVIQGSHLTEGSRAQVIGPTDPSVGADMLLHFNSGEGPIETARVIRLEDRGAQAVIEVASGERWRMNRRVVANVSGPSGIAFRSWTIEADEEAG